MLKKWIHKDLKCQIKLNTEFQFFLGYVRMPIEFSHIDTDNLDVHGGITFSEVDGDYYVLGIDFAHCNDFIPNFPFHHNDEHKWTIEEVKVEVNSLAEQIYDFILQSRGIKVLTTPQTQPITNPDEPNFQEKGLNS